MFCKRCGAQLPESAQFCDKCGAPQQVAQAPQQPQYQAPQQPQYQAPQQPQYQAPQQPQYQAPQQPQYQAPQQPQYQAPYQPQYQAPKQPKQAGNLAATLKMYTPFIAVGMAALALIFGFITLFNLFDVEATASFGSFGSQTASGPVSDIIEGDGMGMVLVGNILFGLVLIVIAAVGGLFFAKKFNFNLYDKLTVVPFVTKESPIFAMGALGAIGAILHFICYLCAGSSESAYGATVSVSVSAPWFTWFILVIFAGIAAVDMFVINKKK